MQEHESQFNIPEEKLRAMREEHEKEEQAVERGETTPLSEVASEVEKEIEEEKRSLEPSREIRLLLDKEGGFLSERQRELLKTSAYFNEQMIERFFEIIRGERTWGGAETKDLDDMEASLRDLTAKYEDILERDEEYPAARDMIRDLRDYVDAIRKDFEKENVSQPASLAWNNLARRVENFNENLLLGDAKNIEQKQYLYGLWQQIKLSILNRQPEFTTSRPKQERESKADKMAASLRDKHEEIRRILGKRMRGEALTPEEEKFKKEELKETEEYIDYMDEHYHSEDVSIPLPEEDVRNRRDELKKLIQEKGKEVKRLGGKRIVIQGENVERILGGREVEIWFPGVIIVPKEGENIEYPVQIRIVGENERVVDLDQNGSVRTVAEYYDDEPDSIEEASRLKQIPPEEWKRFIESALDLAREYTPEKPEERQQ